MTRAYATGKAGDFIILGDGDDLPGGYTLLEPPAQIEGHRVSWDGEAWTLEAIPEPVPEPDPGLPPLTARQLRLGLIAAGIALSSVEAAVAAIEDAAGREIAKVEWEYASQFDRDHPLIEQVGVALGLTPEQIDAAWLAAVNL